MVNRRCHNCGQANDLEATFCVKCASLLHRDRASAGRSKKVLVPPQDSLYQTPTSASSTSASPAGWWLVGMIVVGGLLAWIIYLYG